MSIKKAVLIGINYINTENQLAGCINDVLSAKDLLIQHYGFSVSDILLLTDDGGVNASFAGPTGWIGSRIPTRDVILRSFDWINQGSGNGSHLYLHYSGHGSYIVDTSGDESSGRDEAICPLDFDRAGLIIDDEIRTRLALKVPVGAKLVSVFDSCFSGTAMDLRYNFVRTSNGRNIRSGRRTQNTRSAKIGQKFLSLYAWPTNNTNLINLLAYFPQNLNLDAVQIESPVKPAASNIPQISQNLVGKLVPDTHYSDTAGDIIFLSGSSDYQTSADGSEAGIPGGALSNALFDTLRANNYDITYAELLIKIQNLLVQEGYEQTPQLSFGRNDNPNIKFAI